MADIQLHPISKSDRHWLKTLARLHFGSGKMIVHGAVFSIAEEEGFIAMVDRKRVGAVTLKKDEESCEIVFLDALESREDIFTSLLEGAERWSRGCGCTRLIGTTTNDNTDALCIYQQYGFHLSILRMDAVTASRKKKPEIPETGDNGISIRDELELELEL